jgi:predicted RNA binding protein YcfA (HicA-like mRNA interferase family)
MVDSKRAQRLYERVAVTRNNCSFTDLRALLEAVGFVARQPRRGGSHYTFKRGAITITVPRAKPVKRRYVEAVLELVEES